MYKVGVIGLGSIAAFYGKPDDQAPYCHVGGIRHSDRVSLVAVADLDDERHERFRSVWGECFPDLRYHDSAKAMLAAEELDIVAVCNRGPNHYETMLQVLEAEPRTVFLEKPAVCSPAQADEVFGLAEQKGIPITVSFTRHWAPHVLRLQELVQQGRIGRVQTVVGYTGEEFLSYASHTTDLICQFAGYCPTAIYARGAPGEDAPDGFEPEPALLGALIEFANGVTALHTAAPGEHGGFYVDVFGADGRVRAGIYTAPVVADKDGGIVDSAELEIPEDDSPFRMAYDQIAGWLDGGPLAHCTDSDARIVGELGFAGIESALTGERIVLPVANRTRKVFANG